MENRHRRSQAAHRVQKLMLVALVALVAVVDLSNCQAICLCGTAGRTAAYGVGQSILRCASIEVMSCRQPRHHWLATLQALIAEL